MLRITIDLVPFGKEEFKRQLRLFEIYNTGTTHNPDTYHVRENGEILGGFKHFRDEGLEVCLEKAIEYLPRTTPT